VRESTHEGEAEVGVWGGGGGTLLVKLKYFFFLINAVKTLFRNFEQVGKMLSLAVAGQRALVRINFVYFAIIDACNLVYF
jgi:hypothetical protein